MGEQRELLNDRANDSAFDISNGENWNSDSAKCQLDPYETQFDFRILCDPRRYDFAALRIFARIAIRSAVNRSNSDFP